MGTSTSLQRLVEAAVGPADAARLLDVLRVPTDLQGVSQGGFAPRVTLAMALNILLFHDLITRTPTAAAYVEDRRIDGTGVTFDHGALRTIRFADGPTGELPPGEAAFTRILEPLGYRLVFDSALDPLDDDALQALDELGCAGGLDEAEAARLLPVLTGAFSRRHAIPRLSDYQALLAESAEAAWIATEGSAFNHATDRVADVHALASTQRALGRAMKAEVEVSASGRVRQTAFRADPVERMFRDADDREAILTVPGSFYEFITRDAEPDGSLDLRFDSANAQGIFKMTAPQGGYR